MASQPAYFGLFGVEGERAAGGEGEVVEKVVVQEEKAEEDAEEVKKALALKAEAVLLNSQSCCVCDSLEWKYKCPACGLRSCCFECVKKHKARFSCDGKRDRTPFVKMDLFDQKQFVDDYYFLEDATRTIDGITRDRRNIVQSMGQLPPWLQKLRYEARMRGTRLKLLPAGFKKRIQNKTTFMYREKAIFWDIELLFDGVQSNDGQPLVLFSHRVPETFTLQQFLEQYVDPKDLLENFELNKKLVVFREKGFEGLTVLLRLDSNKCTEMNVSQSIQSNLVGKTIVEFPTFVVVFKESKIKYQLIEEKCTKSEENPKPDEVEGENEEDEDES